MKPEGAGHPVLESIEPVVNKSVYVKTDLEKAKEVAEELRGSFK